MQPEQSAQQPAQPPAQPPANQPESPWQFNDEDPDPQYAGPQPPSPAVAESVDWTASEFVAHQKGAGWYMLLALGAVVVTAIVYFTTKDVIATVVILFAALAFGIFAARKPRVLQYRIDNYGLHIETKLYHYESFKSFAVIEDDAIHSVLLLPMKRFMPSLTIYYAPEDEPRIVNALAAYLPLQPAENDLFDRLMRKIRF